MVEATAKEYQWIVVEETGASASGKTRRYEVRAKHGQVLLGTIRYWSHWRQHVFCPEPSTVYSAGCLIDVADFIRRKAA